MAEAADIALEGRATVSYDEASRLWIAAERLTGDPAVGHRAGVQTRIHELGPAGAVFAHATDLRLRRAPAAAAVLCACGGEGTSPPGDAVLEGTLASSAGVPSDADAVVVWQVFSEEGESIYKHGEGTLRDGELSVSAQAPPRALGSYTDPVPIRAEFR